MKKLLMILFFIGLFGLYTEGIAQNYSGTYTMNTSNGVLTLRLNQQSNGTLTGELVGSNGYRISLKGEVADGIGEGMATDSKGSAFFEVHYEGGKLLFYLMDQNSDQGKSLYFEKTSANRPGKPATSIGAGAGASAASRNPLAGGGSASFNGTFSGDGVTLSLQSSGKSIQGTLVFNGSRFPVTGAFSGNAATGRFSANGSSYPFSARLSGSTMKFSTGGTNYSLRRKGGSRVAARPSNPLQRTSPPRNRGTSNRGRPVQAAAPVANRRTVTDSQAGVTFTIPSGWTAKKNMQGYILVSTKYNGLIAITGNPYHSLQELQQGAGEGIVDKDNGIQLMPMSRYERIGSNGMGGEFSGQVNGQAARAYVAGLVSPQPGAMGLTIIALTSSAAYNSRYSQWAKSIAASVRLSAPRTDQALMAWFSAVYWNYSGSSSSYGGISHEHTWTFCSNGRFRYHSEDSASVTGTYGSASSDDARGTWTLYGNRSKGVITLTYSHPANLGVRDLRYAAIGDGSAMWLEDEKYQRKGRANCQ